MGQVQPGQAHGTPLGAERLDETVQRAAHDDVR
jgi:hypothetical protein